MLQLIEVIWKESLPSNLKSMIGNSIIKSYVTKFLKNRSNLALGVLNSIKRENAPFLIYLSVSNKNGILAFKLLSKMWHELLFSTISEEEISLAKEKLKGSFLISNQSLDNIFNRKIQLLGYEMSPNADDDFFSEIDTVSSNKIKEIANKYLSNPYLSITGEKGKCLEIKERWINYF